MIKVTLACALFYLSAANRLLLQYQNMYNPYAQNPFVDPYALNYGGYNPYGQGYNPYQYQQPAPYQGYQPGFQPQPIPQPNPNNPAAANPNLGQPAQPPATGTPGATTPASPAPPAAGTPPAGTPPATGGAPPAAGTPGGAPPAAGTPGAAPGAPGAGAPVAPPPAPFGRAIYPGGAPGMAIGGFVPPMAELICDMPAGMLGSCAGGRTTISNVIDNFKMQCNAAGSCQNSDVTMNLNGMAVRAVEGIWCSEPGSCAGSTLKLRNTAGGNNIELSRLECSTMGSCNGMTIDVLGISVNDLDCPYPENCMGCTVIDRQDFPPVPKPCFGW